MGVLEKLRPAGLYRYNLSSYIYKPATLKKMGPLVRVKYANFYEGTVTFESIIHALELHEAFPPYNMDLN